MSVSEAAHRLSGFQSSEGWSISAGCVGERALCRYYLCVFAKRSISFSQEIIWFEVGMLWDAKLESPSEISRK